MAVSAFWRGHADIVVNDDRFLDPIARIDLVNHLRRQGNSAVDLAAALLRLPVRVTKRHLGMAVCDEAWTSHSA